MRVFYSKITTSRPALPISSKAPKRNLEPVPSLDPVGDDLTERIEQAARDAGLCETCGKPHQFTGDYDNWCQCDKSNVSALFRLDQIVSYQLINRIALEAE